MPAKIQELTRDSFAKLVEQSSNPVLIDFWGPQCRPCLALSPTFEKLADSYEGLTFLKASAPANRMLCVDLKVMALPTFLCMVNGQESSRLTGEISAARLKDWVKEQDKQVKGGAS
jgi:thioredoxin 1